MYLFLFLFHIFSSTGLDKCFVRSEIGGTVDESAPMPAHIDRAAMSNSVD